MKNFPEEMLIEILAKNPVDSLMRLSCVCKSWRDLIIRNPYFGEKQLNNNVNNSKAVIFLRYRSKIKGAHEALLSSRNPWPLTRQLQKLEFTRVVGSCNGIICLAYDSVCLYNPVTREEKKLPANISGGINRNSYSGFGYDKSTDDYKVIRIAKHAEVYKLSTNEWSVLDVNLKSEFYFLGIGVFLNGFCHWPVELRETISRKILTFNLRDETFGENIAYPGGGLLLHLCIGVLDESLAVCVSSRVGEIEVWVMTEYGKNNSWAKKFSFEISLETLTMVAFWVHDMKIAMLGVGFPGRHGSQLVACSSEEKKCRIIMNEVVRYGDVSGAVFQPTLVPLSGRRSKFDLSSV